MCEIDYGYLQMMRSDVMIADKTKYNDHKACPFFCKCKCKRQLLQEKTAVQVVSEDKQLEIGSKSPSLP